MIENALIVIILIAVCIVTDVAILVLAKIFPKYRPTEIKHQRFEAGNPPLGVPKWVLPMQYVGFMLMFMAAEPILVLLLLFSAFPRLDVYAITLIAFILLLPAVYAGYQYTLEIAKLNRGDVYG
jgi:NADH-quinone oxidoreductase subunit A